MLSDFSFSPPGENEHQARFIGADGGSVFGFAFVIR
jgi:hypothetical protein